MTGQIPHYAVLQKSSAPCMLSEGSVVQIKPLYPTPLGLKDPFDRFGLAAQCRQSIAMVPPDLRRYRLLHFAVGPNPLQNRFIYPSDGQVGGKSTQRYVKLSVLKTIARHGQILDFAGGKALPLGDAPDIIVNFCAD